MKRRVALKNVAAAIGGLLILPEWANGWSVDSLPATKSKFLSPAAGELLAEVVETFIPKTDTPGAKELGVNLFVEKMIADCYSPETQKMFAEGLAEIESLSKEHTKKAFKDCDTAKRIEVLQLIEQKENLKDPGNNSTEPKNFFKLLKSLTTRGYSTSEYVLKNFSNYTMIPGHFYGCVPVSSK